MSIIQFFASQKNKFVIFRTYAKLICEDTNQGSFVLVCCPQHTKNASLRKSCIFSKNLANLQNPLQINRNLIFSVFLVKSL
jgi:hypothetical protein